jgi:hypothetical protein
MCFTHYRGTLQANASQASGTRDTCIQVGQLSHRQAFRQGWEAEKSGLAQPVPAWA